MRAEPGSEADAEDAVREALLAWLERGARDGARGFPPELERRFEAETGGRRRRAAGLLCLTGALVALFLYAALVAAVPDAHAVSQAGVLGVALPSSVAAALALLLAKPSPAVREAIIAMPTIIYGLVVNVLFSTSHADVQPLFLGAVMLLMIFAGAVIQLRFTLMALSTGLILGGYAAALTRGPGLPPLQALNQTIIAITGGLFTLLANWRLHTEQRVSYAYNLRERLRHTELSLRNKTLDELVRHDALTGLANRRAYDAWLQNAWMQARGDSLVGLIIIDVDRFKAYNDFYGHAGGDTCLQTIARCLREQLRGTSDLVARIGGEEFAILLPGLGVEICAEIAERLRCAVDTLCLPHLGAGGTVSISCGVASLPAGPPYTAAELFATADAALYEAKQTGRNRVCLAETRAQAESAGRPAAERNSAVNDPAGSGEARA